MDDKEYSLSVKIMEKRIFDEDRFSIKEIDGETMIYDSVNDRTHFLNPTALQIFELVSEGKNKEEIEKVLRMHFSIQDDADIGDDIEKTLLSLREKNLIE